MHQKFETLIYSNPLLDMEYSMYKNITQTHMN